MRGIWPTVDRETAWRQLHAARWHRARQLFRSVGRWFAPAAEDGVSDSRLPYLERVWLPVYTTTVEVTARGRASTLRAVVGACDRSCTLLAQDCPVREVATADDVFQPVISSGKAEGVVREHLKRILVGRKGARVSVSEIAPMEPICYPYWVYYYERGRGRLDFRMLDAATGTTLGSKAKVVFLEALMQRDERP